MHITSMQNYVQDTDSIYEHNIHAKFEVSWTGPHWEK